MLDILLAPNTLIAFLTLAALEVVLGIDNIIFISILVNRLPSQMRNTVRRFGLMFALLTRILLLFSLTWMIGLVEPLFFLNEHPVSGRDLILFLGGLFLLWKSSKEIYLEVEAKEEDASAEASPEVQSNLGTKAKMKLFWGTIIQIGVLDIVFSLDSVITAVGLVNELAIMVAAVVAAMAVMLFAAKPIGEFIHKHPSLKVLALAFLVVIGVVLIVEGLGQHVPKGYIYFAMGFSLGVELLNIWARSKRKKRMS